MSLLTIPDVPLLFIMENLPLLDLFRLYKVSPHLADKLVVNIREACSRRRYLALFIGPDADRLLHKNQHTGLSSAGILERDIVRFKWSRLDISMHCFQPLFRLPNIAHLTIVMANIPSRAIAKIFPLLEHWTPTLQSFKLITHFNDTSRETNPHDCTDHYYRGLLSETLQGMNSLTSLTLDAKFCSSLMAYAEVKQQHNLVNISIHDSADAFIGNLLTLKTIVGPAFRSLRFTPRPLTILDSFAPHLINLTSLTLDFELSHWNWIRELVNPISIADLSRHLSQLVSLTDLTLNDLCYGFIEEAKPGDQLVSLGSIRKLTLTTRLSVHSKLPILHFGFLFPSVDNLNIRILNCGACDILPFTISKEECMFGFIEEIQGIQFSGRLTRFTLRNGDLIYDY